VIDQKMTNSEYHAHHAISKSGLDRIDQSPAHYQAWLSEPRITTPALTFGSACHSFVLERETFGDRYAVAPSGIDRRTKAGKELWEAFTTESAGREIITAEDMDKLCYIRASIIDHPVAEELLDHGSGKAEVSVFGVLDDVGVKCRPDWLRGDGILVDLKTTDCAAPNAFARSVAKYRYHVQAAFYSDLLQAVTGEPVKAFVFIAVEKAPPYAVSVYELDAESLEVGRAAYQRNLDTFRRCLEANHWPAYSNAIETLTLPRWALAEAA